MDSEVAALVVDVYSLENKGDAAIYAGLIATLRSAGVTHVAVAVPQRWHADAERWRELGADEIVPPLAESGQPSGLVARSGMVLDTAWGVVKAHLFAGRSRPVDKALAPYKRASVVVAAGGGYLGGTKPGVNLVKGLNIAAGRLAGRPTVVAGVSVARVNATVGRVLRWALRDAKVFVREEPSRLVLAGIGVESQMVRDLAFRAPSIAAALRGAGPGERREAETNRPRPVIGWVPRDYRPWHMAWRAREDVEATSVQAMSGLLRDGLIEARFVAHVTASESDDDRRAIARLREKLSAELRPTVTTQPVQWSLTDTLEAYASFDAMLTSRMHASLFALAVGTPALVVGYDEKVRGVMDGLGLGHRVISAGRVADPTQMAAQLLALLSDEERSATQRARERATEGFEGLDEWLRLAIANRTTAP